MHWIDGTWIYDRESLADWRRVLDQLTTLGGSIMLQFGSAFHDCDENKLRGKCNRPGLPAGFLPVNGTLAGYRVVHQGFWEGEDLFDGPLPNAHPLSGIVTISPANGEPQQCWRLVADHASGGIDVVYGFGRRSLQQRRLDWLLEAAAERGIGVLLGMPMLPGEPEPGGPQIHNGLLPIWGLVTQWWLSNVRNRFSNHPVIVGFYQSFETDLRPGYPAWDAYRQVRDLMDTVYHPSARLAISPYVDCVQRHNVERLTAEIIAEAVEQCARSGVDILIPQDGRGSGLNALFWDYERGSRVVDHDPALGNYVTIQPHDTNGTRFSLSTGEMYEAVRRAVDRANANGVKMALWANVEAFEMDSGDPGFDEDRSRMPWARNMRATTRERLDRAAMFAAGHCSRMISFMWDPYFTTPRGAQGSNILSMFDSITADPDRPLISEAHFFDTSGTQGIITRGYNLVQPGVRIGLTWYENSIGMQSRTHTVGTTGWVDPSFGRRDARRPARLQEIFIPFDRTVLIPSWWIHLQASNPQTGPTPVYSMRYP